MRSRQRLDVAGLGAEIRAARRRQNLTQEALASLAGVGTRFVSELERGKATVQLGLAIHLARLLGLELTLVERSKVSLPHDAAAGRRDAP